VGPCLDLLLQNADRKSSGFRSGEYGGQSAEFRHVVCQEVLGDPRSVDWRQILLVDVVAVWISPLNPGDHMLLQKVLINISVDSLANDNKNDQTLLATPRTICF
jgi:hypothetical protein